VTEKEAETGEQSIARKIVGTRLFLISYSPLWAMFAIRSPQAAIRTGFWALAAWGIADAFRLIVGSLRRSARRIHFDDVSDKSGEVSGYLATYLLPFIAGPPSDLEGWLAYAVYFSVAWAVFVPSNLGLVNPVLYVLGWRVFEGSRNGHREILICQNVPMAGTDEPVARLMGGVGWVQRPTRKPWTLIAQRPKPPGQDE
jgi:hypothetical protein